MPEPGDPQSLNRFSYVGNNPVRYADPTGHWPDPWYTVQRLASRAYRNVVWINDHVEVSPEPKSSNQLSEQQQLWVDTLNTTAVIADTVALGLSAAGAVVEGGIAIADGPAPIGDGGALAIYFGAINPVENIASGVGYVATLSADTIAGDTFIQFSPFAIGLGQDSTVSTITTAAGNLLPLEGFLDSAVNSLILSYDSERIAGDIPTIGELRFDWERGLYIILYPAPGGETTDE